MASNYAVQGEVIDIRADRPKPTDVFLVDSNVWLWMKPIEVTTGSATTDAALARLSSQHLDGHDLFRLEAMTAANVTQILTTASPAPGNRPIRDSPGFWPQG